MNCGFASNATNPKLHRQENTRQEKHIGHKNPDMSAEQHVFTDNSKTIENARHLLEWRHIV